MLSQANGTGGGGTVRHLLYDGHGSTRLLIDHDAPGNGQPLVAANYDFDAYGNALSDISNATTSLLYAGEYLAAAAGQYYLRARHYDTASGRFNRVDPFAGNNEDPQSLHKYAYAHSNPVTFIDPTGNFTLVELLVVSAVVLIGANILFTGINAATLHINGYRYHSHAYDIWTDFQTDIEEAANENNLEPEYLAAFIIAEVEVLGLRY